MINILQKVRDNRYFLLFILLFAYLQSIYIRIAVRKQIDIYIFTPEAAIATLVGAGVLFLIISFFIGKWGKTEAIQTRSILKIFGASVLVFVLSMQLIGFLVALAFDNLERNFNSHTLAITLFSHFLDGIIYGSFFLTYYYYQNNRVHQRKLANYNQAFAESRINQLKTQLNPHFLFNNLNVLDQLIDEDKQKASDFLNEFAEIYRYVLQSADKDIVSIVEEVDFARQYFSLIEHKYGGGYQLSIKNEGRDGFIAPLTLQLLIENAVQHNLGTNENPVYIRIEVDEKIAISNNVNLKIHAKPTSGRALRNLREQYELLSDVPIEILRTNEDFSLQIPIISPKLK